MSIIKLLEVHKEFDVGRYSIIALDHVSLEIRKGSFSVIQGASGAGKTTLLNIVATLDKPTSGKVLVEDIEVSAMNQDALASWRTVSVGFIFQSFNLLSTMTARENIAFPIVFWGGRDVSLTEKVDELLEIVDLKDREDHLPSQLSAGEKQRVAIARALVNDPPILIADEPTANLDASTASRVIDILEEVKKSNDKTVLVASHDELIADLADDIYIMDEGKIQAKEADL